MQLRHHWNSFASIAPQGRSDSFALVFQMQFATGGALPLYIHYCGEGL